MSGMKVTRTVCKWVMLFTLASMSNMAVAIEIGQVPPKVVLTESSGGLVTGGAWDSSTVQGKLYVLFYVDPGESETNNAAADALHDEKFPLDKVGSIAVVNMEASWLPNVAIDAKLRSKQEKFPDTTYVRDLHKALVKSWQVADNSSDVMLFGKDGKLLFHYDGKVPPEKLKELIDLIKKSM